MYQIKHTPDSTALDDPFNQFRWLESMLCLAMIHEVKVIIVGHIPPIIGTDSGKPEWHEKYVNKYKEIITKYSSTIVTQLFGHVHQTEIR